MESVDLRELFSLPARRQRYLDVESAFAQAEAEANVIPKAAADKISAAAHLEFLDAQAMADEEARTGHSMVPLVSELARVTGEPDGGWVHWGATTQNIQQTGDVLGYRIAIDALTEALSSVLSELSVLGEATADTVMPGRTHWQHAVPITFGFKVAAWSDVFLRHLDRLGQARERILTCMAGGAAGTFASLGKNGPVVQEELGKCLGLAPMPVPSRNIVDPFAELVCVLAMIAATSASIAEEISRLMAAEFGEVSEPVPAGDVGSSTMPQKRNPKLCGRVVISGAKVRALVPIALEAMIQSHEVDGSRSAMINDALQDSCVFTADCLAALQKVLSGLEVFPDRMRQNLDLTGGLISAEAVMMALGEAIGREDAHKVVHDAAGRVSPDSSFAEILAADPRVNAHLQARQVEHLLDPASHLGLSAEIARATSARVREALGG